MNLTYDEIIKILEHYIRCGKRKVLSCDNCALKTDFSDCDAKMGILALDLIKNQKIENEKLQEEIKWCRDAIGWYQGTGAGPINRCPREED